MKIAVIILILIVAAMIAYAVMQIRRDRKEVSEIEKKCDGKLICGWMD